MVVLLAELHVVWLLCECCLLLIDWCCDLLVERLKQHFLKLLLCFVRCLRIDHDAFVWWFDGLDWLFENFVDALNFDFSTIPSQQLLLRKRFLFLLRTTYCLLLLVWIIHLLWFFLILTLSDVVWKWPSNSIAHCYWLLWYWTKPLSQSFQFLLRDKERWRFLCFSLSSSSHLILFLSRNRATTSSTCCSFVFFLRSKWTTCKRGGSYGHSNC